MSPKLKKTIEHPYAVLNYSPLLAALVITLAVCFVTRNVGKAALVGFGVIAVIAILAGWRSNVTKPPA